MSDRITLEAIQQAEDAVAEKAPLGSTWRHKGNQKLYTVVTVGTNEEDLSPVIGYVAIFPIDNPGPLWVRKAEVFFERFEKSEPEGVPAHWED